MIVAKSKTRLGPYDHGRKMSLKSFEFAQVEDGYLFELHRGYVIVSEVANYHHAMQIMAILEAPWAYKIAHPDAIHAILGTMECKLPIPSWDSERHPDIAVYLTRPKGKKDRTLWRTWLPELVIEVVSESSRDRDYVEKRDEYWSLGVKEYWIVDAKLAQVLVLRRGKSAWLEKALGADDVLETKLLPGFKLAWRAIFDAAQEERGEK